MGRPHLDHSEAQRKGYGRWKVRCPVCWQRRTLKLHPDLYQRTPCCFGCGQRLRWWIDWYRMSQELKGRPHCNCGAIAGRNGAIPHNPKTCAALTAPVVWG